MRDIQDSLLVDYAEDEGVLPALLFGWDAPIDAAPEFIVQVNHQFGGYACRQALLSGLLVPLHGNLARARRDPTPLLEGLRAIAESQQDGAIWHRSASSLPLFDAWGYTHGQDMAQADLSEWDRLLGQYYELPPLVRGAEALLEFAPTDASALIGWQAVAGPQRGMQGLINVLPSSLEAIAECRPTDRASSAAKLYLLWESSD